MDQTLPILHKRAQIEAALRAHRVVVVCGETGSGKTTQLPRICLDLGLGGPGKGVIAHTQPRRIAARAVAARIAEEMGVRLGGPVGFKVRFQDQTSRDTTIKVLTDGMLLAELASDPLLRAYSTIIIDEAHERSLNIDFLLGCLRVLLDQRPDLKIVVTSATIDPARFSDYFGGPSAAPVIEVSGRMFPVELRYRPVAGDDEAFERLEVEAVADAVEELTAPSLPKGDVLVFLPGEREIRLAADAVRRRARPGELDILPLFSRLSAAEQDRIFHPPPPHLARARRVILATNVAETSLTVPGIRYVVDTGLARINRYDPAKKIGRLPIEPISRASADQRAGRCGRIAEGVCIRLYSESSYQSRPRFTDPEIRRTSLASVILQMKTLALGPRSADAARASADGAIEDFPFLDPPDPAAVRDGYETLFELGAVDRPSRDGRVTPIGRQVARIPADPRIARMMIAAETEGSLREVIILAAALSIQDPRERPGGRHDQADRAQAVFRHDASDFITLLNIWDQHEHASAQLGSSALASWCRDHFLSPARMREWGEMARQLRDVAQEMELLPNRNRAAPDAIHRALLTGLITNVACREGDAGGRGAFEYRGVRGNRVQIFPGSVLFHKPPRWIMAAEVVETSRIYARTVARIEPEWIEELAGHMFQRQLSDRHLDADSGEPSAWERVTMSGIVVVPRRRIPLAPVDPAAARSLFIRDGLAQGKWPPSSPSPPSPADGASHPEPPFIRHNREVLDLAHQAEARLRRRDVLASADELAEWFARRIPESVVDPASFEAWRIQAERADPRLLMLELADVLKPWAVEAGALDDRAFPSLIELGEGDDRAQCPLHYALAPGKDDDGLTLTIPLTALPHLTPDRAAWLIPGLLPELIAALFKSLPKAERSAVERLGDPKRIAADVAAAVTFAHGALPDALSEALEVLHGVAVPPAAWSLKSLPAHLRMRIRIVDEHGRELAVDRDVAALRERLAGRIRKVQAARARARFERDGLTAWDFGDLPGRAAVERDGETVELFPAIIDRGSSAALTLLDSPERAERETARGVRRLFALACRDEVAHHLRAQPAWDDLKRWYAALGPADQLEDELTCLIAERAFMAGPGAHEPVRSREAFDARAQAMWGRLAAATREVVDVAAGALEPRFRIAQRFSGGTPRLWAGSVADMREQAAYLMPRGFLLLAPWERLRHYPRYVQGIRERLFALREDGSGVEKDALARIAPLWKRFTAWVAQAMAAERAAREEEEERLARAAAAASPAKGKAPLPQARRAAPTVNFEASEWAMQPGNLPPPIDRYRWAIEELRLSLLAPALAAKPAVTPQDVERLWPGGR